MTQENIGAVVLAAGAASRYGQPKELLEHEGRPLIDHACLTALAAGCHPVVRVLGAHAEVIQARTAPPGVTTLVHGDWQAGMGSSLAAGVAKLLELAPESLSLFVLLADQPAVHCGLLEAMKLELARPGISMVLCSAHGETGPPVLFARERFARLLELRSERGGKILAAEQPQAVAYQQVPEAAWIIDSPEVWLRFNADGASSSPP